MYEQALANLEPALGGDHPVVAGVLNNFANVYFESGEYTRALELHERTLASRKRRLGDEHPRVATSIANVAAVHLRRRELDRARDAYQRALGIFESKLPKDHTDIADILVGLAQVALAEKRDADALPLAERAVRIFGDNEGLQESELQAHFTLAKAIVRTGGDEARAIAQANAARDGFRNAGQAQAGKLREVEVWLAELGG